MISSLAWLTGMAVGSANPEQRLVELLGCQDLLIEAPPGCGKTEVLARRAAALVRQGAVHPPRKVLALTFSNRAKDNLKTRLREVMGVRYWERVTVTNFHGLAARVINSHGAQFGIAADWSMPQRGRLSAMRSEVGIDWRNSADVDAAFRAAKHQPLDDDQLIEVISQHSNLAVEYQQLLTERRQLDFMDLLRHADRLLGIDAVGRLYRSHFPAVLVDEAQDLSPQQLRLALTVCGEGVTVAGDLSQGIYSFNGARPVEVWADVMDRRPGVVRLNRSYRSSPEVLACVNALGAITGLPALECATPEDWPNAAPLKVIESATEEQEAPKVLDLVADITANSPRATVGIVSRRRSRSAELLAEAERREQPLENWDDSTHSSRVVGLLRRNCRAAANNDGDQFDVLGAMCTAQVDPDDVELRDEILEAISELRERAVGFGADLPALVATCRVQTEEHRSVGPGVHLLTAHAGKGQQFDWVVVLGLENGHIPDFRATTPEAEAEELRVLRVIVSRARFGLVITRTHHRRDRYGRVHVVEPSPWWGPLIQAAS